jgi:hypothetical protein
VSIFSSIPYAILNKFVLAALAVFSCISYTDSVQRPFELTFNFGRRKKFAGERSGLQSGCGTSEDLFFARNFWKDDTGPSIDVPACTL